ncbi:stage II sporulation protein B [Halobacillus dabanensis]|uniref:Stage II sporulation protein B n=1 Tax=Halobacillus dabanensis TaxID=240302 RepID=A0A1I3P3T7_HALDA|nr:SPOR domain-containing protein [Halobacillus dabanensis]SFJ16194.1 stage II sporulation protein B [Halobacillus dabanensis]
MDSKNKISISFRDQDHQNTKHEVVRTQKEQAAAVEKHKEDEQSTTPVYKLPHKKKRVSNAPVRPLITTALTALFVSLGIGFLLLRMFVSLTDQTATGNETVPVTGSSETNTESAVEGSNEEGSTTQLPDGTPQTFDSYIVQAGAFSTEGKAKEWQSRLTAQLIPSVIWKRDGQYFLFVGSAASKQEAEMISDRLAEESIDTYVKPFSVKTQKEIPSGLKTPIETHAMGDLSEGKRQEVMEEVGADTSLGQALSEWESQDDTNINWLRVTQSLE